MKKPFTIFIDFDDVLFDTPTLIKKARHIFRKYGISYALENVSYKKMITSKTGYHIDRQLGYLKERLPNLSVTILKKEIQEAWNPMQQYLYPDARSFLKSIRQFGWHAELVTAGDPIWQKHKVAQSKIASLLTAIHYVPTGEKKSVPILKRSGENHFVFIDDRGQFIDDVKQVFGTRAHVIQLCRRRSKERTQKADAIRQSLTSSLPLVKRLASKHGG